MRIFSNFPHELPPEASYPVVTVGVFDGLHVGHRQLLETAFRIAGSRPVALVTFDPHPRAVLGPPKRHRLLAPLAERLQLLSALPLAAVAVLRFDRDIAQTPYDDFVRRWLVEGLGARHLVLGYNVRLGYERRGDPETLAALGERLGYELTLVPACQVDGAPVSSTRIRHLLDGGDVAAAAALLGRPYDIAGTVVRGAGRGRALGAPTANLEVPADKLLPANGVYAVTARSREGEHTGALNIGVVPTFGGTGGRSVEVHLLDFEGDLYGTRLQVSLHRRLREERRFDGPEALRRAIAADLEQVRALLGPG